METRNRLRDAGLRCTPARIQVLKRLAAAHQPLSHAEVSDALGPDGFDKSTIFRCLIELSDAGIVARLVLGDQVQRFEFRGPGDQSDPSHAHFVCVDCGKVECLEDYEIQASSRKNRRRLSGHDITEVLFKGHCPKCK